MLAASSAAVAAALINAATMTALVWSTATDVSRGHPVEPEQLVAVEVSESVADRLLVANTESHEALTGRVWAVDLPAGALLAPPLTMERVAIAEGRALVGLQLSPGGFPIVGLGPGDVVMVVEAAGQQGAEPRVLVEAALVESVAALGDQGLTSARLVTLSVPEELVAAVSNAGAAGQASIAVVAR